MTIIRPASRSAMSDDSGLSLVELVVYAALSVVVLAGLAILLFNMWTAQSRASTVADATTRGSLATQNIEKAMRNAQAYVIDPTQTVLSIHTTLSGARTCQAFRVSGGQLQMLNSSGAISSGTWRTMAKGAGQVGTAPYFKLTGTGVAYSIQLNTTATPVRFVGTPVPRATTEVSSPCW